MSPPFSPDPLPRRRQFMLLGGLSLLFVVTYGFNFRSTQIGDAEAHAFQAASLAWTQDYQLDEYRPMFLNWFGGELPYYVYEGPGGHIRSIFNFFPGTLLAPFFWIAGRIAGGRFIDSTFAWSLMGKVVGSLMVWGAGMLLWQLLHRRVGWRFATVVIAAFWWGTPLWPASIDYLQHNPLVFFQAAALLALFGQTGNSPPRFFSGGLLLALSVLCRYQTVGFAALLGVALLLRHRRNRRVWLMLLGGLIPLPFTMAYHHAAFGSVTGAEPLMFLQFNMPLVPTLGMLLLSPSKGLLIYSPWVAFAGPALWRCLGHGTRKAKSEAVQCVEPWLVLPLAAGCVPGFILYGKVNGWFGGWSWGYRFLLDMIVPLTVVAAIGMRLWLAPASGKAGGRFYGFVRQGTLAAAVGWAIFVGAIGAAAYDHAWHRVHDLNMNQPQGWLKQVRHSQIPFTARRGRVYFMSKQPTQLARDNYAPRGLEIGPASAGDEIVWSHGREIRFYCVAYEPEPRLELYPPPDMQARTFTVKLDVEGARTRYLMLDGTGPLTVKVPIAHQRGAMIRMQLLWGDEETVGVEHLDRESGPSVGVGRGAIAMGLTPEVF